MPALVLVADGKETRYDLGSRTVVVGRSVECDVQVSEERASRRHFEIVPTDRGYLLRDLESSNGTALNGYGISQAVLSPGDVVELGGMEFRFEAEGAPAAAKAVRAPRKKPSAGPAWVAALAVALAAAAITDEMVLGAAAARDAEIRGLRAQADHAAYLVASRQPDPAEAAAALESWLSTRPAAADAAAARAQLEEIRAGQAVRQEAARDWDAFRAAGANLAPVEQRWRLEALLRRWSGDPRAVAEIRARAAALPKAAEGREDSRLHLQRRKREADAALDEGNPGVALSLWNAHAATLPPADPTMDDVRGEVRRVERAAAVRAEELLQKAIALRDQGKPEDGLRLLRESLPPLEGTGGGRRVAARIEAGLGSALPRGGKGPGAGGFARQRSLYLKAREAEQFVAVKDYRAAAAQYAAIAAEAAEFPKVKQEMETRAAWLARTGDLIDASRALPGSWKGKAWPEDWKEAPPAEVLAALQKAARKPEDRLAVASFCWDQGLRAQAIQAVALALEQPATHADAEKVYALREGIEIPEGGFVAEKGEILSKAEWNRRRNAEAIAKLRERETLLVKRLRETQLVRGIEKIADLRAELDKRRAFALELIFDEARYFYPYQDRMGEYAPVQQEVNKRVAAVREVWEARAKLHTKPDPGTAGILKELDEAARQIREMGGEGSAQEAEAARLRLYFDRDLDVRTYFRDAAELAGLEHDVGVLRENATRKNLADETEQKQVLVTNEYRMMFGRRALLVADRLVLSARAHGNDMSKGGFFSHFNEKLRGMKPGEKIPEQACGCSSDRFLPGCSHGPESRISKQGYAWIACSENIHAGSGDPEGAHEGWIHSSGHHRNILAAEWKEMGTGRSGKYWTQNFGLPSEPAAAPSAEAGSTPWDGAGGRGTGGDGNAPKER